MLVISFLAFLKKTSLLFSWHSFGFTDIDGWAIASRLSEARANKQGIFLRNAKKSLLSLLSVFVLVGCQTPETIMTETDSGFENRTFSRVEYGKKVDLKKVVIVDVRSRFNYEMSRLPRSFHAYWKDWDLRGLAGPHLISKKNELQRLLSLKGIDPLTQVVVLGEGLKGQGEEFLLATTLLSLGVERINFMNFKQAEKALVSKGVPPLENTPYWSKDLKYNFNCKTRESDSKKIKQMATITIDKKGRSAETFFDKSMKVIPQSFPKNMNVKVYSPNSLWAYGLALYFKDQGRDPCVL